MQHSSLTPALGHVRRVLLVAAVVLGVTVVLLSSGMPSARAHDELVATTPAAGAAEPVPPAAVTLEFNRAVQSLGAQVVVTGPDGAPASQGAAEVRDATVVQPLAAGAPAGPYNVAWRVTASDGHALSGEFGFTVAGGPSAATSPAGPDPLPAEVEVSGTASEKSPDPGVPYGPVGIGAALLAAAGGLVLLLRRRRS